MKLRYRITLGILGVLAGSLAVLALLLGHESACEPAPDLAADAQTMKAYMHRCYGSPDVLTLEDVAKPEPGHNELLVRVHAASVNPYDWHDMRGSPYFMRLGSGFGRPKDPRLGADFAGTVEAVGKDVSRFQSGDRVFGGAAGAFGQYVTIAEDRGVALLPAGVAFEQAAAMPIAAISALQALRDKGKLQAGQKVLINGASGGVGTFAVQIAKSYGADVTGVCSTRNVEMVRSIGADHVIDYKTEDYTEGDTRYDLIVDMVGNHSLFANRRVLNPGGTLVMVGGQGGDWLGPLMRPIGAVLLSPFVDETLVMLLARMDGGDLAELAGLMESGDVTSVIDKRYPLAELPEAIRYSETGRARGKIIVNVD